MQPIVNFLVTQFFYFNSNDAVCVNSENHGGICVRYVKENFFV